MTDNTAILDRVEKAISAAAYPDVHPDFTDAGWARMARAAVDAMREPTPEMITAALKDQESRGLLTSQARPNAMYGAMIGAALGEQS